MIHFIGDYYPEDDSPIADRDWWLVSVYSHYTNGKQYQACYCEHIIDKGSSDIRRERAIHLNSARQMLRDKVFLPDELRFDPSWKLITKKQYCREANKDNLYNAYRKQGG